MISIFYEAFCVSSTSLTFHCNANAVVILWLKSYLLRILFPSYAEALGNAHITKLAADFVSRVDMRENIFSKFPSCD